jgi:hypothetical protein
MKLKLEQLIREKVEKTERVRVGIMKLKSMEEEHNERTINVTKYKNLCQY